MMNLNNNNIIEYDSNNTNNTIPITTLTSNYKAQLVYRTSAFLRDGLPTTATDPSGTSGRSFEHVANTVRSPYL